MRIFILIWFDLKPHRSPTARVADVGSGVEGCKFLGCYTLLDTHLCATPALESEVYLFDDQYAWYC